MSLYPKTTFNAYRGHVLAEAPASLPITAAELRLHLNEGIETLPDAEADGFIEEAVDLIQQMTGLALVTQSWLMSLDQWPMQSGLWWSGVRQGSISALMGSPLAIGLPRYPLQSVTSVLVFDDAGNSTAVDVAATFDVDVYQSPGRMALRAGAAWPVAMRETDAIRITYVAGFGSGAAIPAALRRAVKQVAAHLYSHRGDGCDMGDALAAAGSLLDAYKVVRL